MKHKEEITDYKMPIIKMRQDKPDHPDNLLAHPFRGLVLGPSNSGKTYTIVSMLAKWYKKYFDKIYLISPNAKVGKTNPWDLLKLKEEHVFTDYNSISTVINDVMNDQEQNDRKDKILIIMDDCAAKLSQDRAGAMANFIIQCRHFNTSCLLTTQKLRLLPSVIRNNVDHYLCFKITNGAELKTLLEENGDAKNMKEIYEEAVRPSAEHKYPFFHLNKRTNRFFKAFDTEIIPEEDNEEEEPKNNITQ